jgi:hypothetical protein
MISEYIRCEFETEEGFCHWQVEASEETPHFAWTRQTAEGIEVSI